VRRMGHYYQIYLRMASDCQDPSNPPMPYFYGAAQTW
jgi:hypothetical protein